jgi:hypothetical protein
MHLTHAFIAESATLRDDGRTDAVGISYWVELEAAGQVMERVLVIAFTVTPADRRGSHQISVRVARPDRSIIGSLDTMIMSLSDTKGELDHWIGAFFQPVPLKIPFDVAGKHTVEIRHNGAIVGQLPYWVYIGDSRSKVTITLPWTELVRDEL